MVAARKVMVMALVSALWLCAATGCYTHRPGHGNLLDPGPEPVQGLIEQRMIEQRDAMSGRDRWENFKKDDYQSAEDIVRNREHLSEQRQREEVAREAMAAGPIDLLNCLTLALEFNDQVQARREAIKAVGGEELIVRSRFLPQLFYDLDHLSRQGKAGSPRSVTNNFFRISQTLLEFGKDNIEDVRLREVQRRALFDYEDTVSEVLSEVRQRFFTVILRQQQLAQREVLLGEFSLAYQRMQKRYDENRQVPEVDVLTSLLNVLNEKSRINSLQTELVRQKIDLLHFIGLPVALTDFELSGSLARFDLALTDIVAIALQRSTEIALARAEVAEQRRVARQVLWEYGPDVQLQSGWKDDKTIAGMELSGADGFYELSPFAEYHLDSPEDGFSGGQNVLAGDEQGWFMGLSLELPIFKGLERTGRYTREIAQLNEERHELRDIIDQVEVDVGKSYQSLLESREEMRIRGERVGISKKRLIAKERLKELDRISDNELETFRERFFSDQDAYFVQQIAHVVRQERLRFQMRYFESTEAQSSIDKQ